MYRMGRKFRLHHKKGKYGITVLVISIPLSAISTTSSSGDDSDDDTTPLLTSLRRHLYTTGIVKSLDSLHDRILRAGVLPPGLYVNLLFFTLHSSVCVCTIYWLGVGIVGWIISASLEQLAVCKLRLQSTPDIEFCLMVSNDFSWKAHFCGKELQ